MIFTPKDIRFAQREASKHPSIHLSKLVALVCDQAEVSEIFKYALPFLPNLKNEKGKFDLERAQQYVPEVVNFFDTLADLPALPEELSDLATELAIFANGESIQTDKRYLEFDAEAEIKKALKKVSGPEQDKAAHFLSR